MENATAPESSTPDTGLPGKLSFLNPEWINERTMNVAKRVDALLERIEEGLTEGGFLPFESPITDDMLKRMSPDQFRILFDTTPSLEGKSLLLQRMKALKLPLPIELPRPEAIPSATKQLSFDAGAMGRVSSVGKS